MVTANRWSGRRVSVYVTAQVVGLPLALLAGWVLVQSGVPLWGVAAPWLVLTVHLSRKRLPTETVGSALQLAAVCVFLLPLAYLPEFLARRDVGTATLATELFGPALVLLVAGTAAYVVGLLLKRRAARRLARQARTDPYRLE